MCAYNATPYIKEAIDSILNQNFKEFEFIIINDASTDDTGSVILSYNDHRIKYYENEKNLGLTVSLNIGLSKCRGKYIARMDADDISMPDRLEKQVRYMEEHLGVDILGTNFIIEGKEYILPESHQDCEIMLLEKPCFGHPTVFFRSSSVKDKQLRYNEEIQFAQDYALWIDAVMNKLKLANLQKSLLVYRVHNGQVSEKKRALQSSFFKKSQLRYATYVFGNRVNKFKDIYLTLFQNHEIHGENYYKIKVLVESLLRLNKTGEKIDSNRLFNFLYKRLDELFLSLITDKKASIKFSLFLYILFDKRFRNLLDSKKRLLFIKRFLRNAK